MSINMKEISRVVALGAALALAGNSVHAGITYVVDATTTSVIPGLTGFSTTGAMMSGMGVSASFSGGVSETRSWATTGASSGGVTGTGWGLSETGDTFGGLWNFIINPNANLGSLLSLVLSGNSGLTVFDRSFGGAGTTGSANGIDFGFASGFSGDATVTYSDLVAINPNPAVGDLFHVVTVDFGTGGPRGNFSFIQDTDNDSRFGRTVPEPASLALLGLGLAGLALSRRNNKQT